jgi:hypothetical protein
MCAEPPAGQREGCRRRPDDVVLARQQASRVQVEQPGQQLAPGQVACGTEQHDNVVFGWPGRVIPGHVKNPGFLLWRSPRRDRMPGVWHVIPYH